MSAHDRAERQRRYRLAATSLMRETTLDALRELLLERPWPTITMTDVAVAAGMSRQTIYKEFRSRRGLAEGYALRLTDSLVTVIESALYDNPDDVTTALRQGYATFFALSGADPLVRSLHQGQAPEDLLRLITTDSDIIIRPAAERLAETLQRSWVNASAEDANILAHAIVRLALSFIANPPEDTATASANTARLFAPFLRLRHP
ncbi:TetR family transcriptional regulator [Rhodococcus sp. USK10]|uniref:Transcriptional regulator, TetR family n=1 Tax=Rhodococcus wratislaviensis TaxID=44752 RepID=A0A402CE38_RHOWR|nr:MULTISPECIES: TetR family transcriptional regulator [Rhodococcus]QYB06540.1 TetR family transcriptional regulator [Rhodococcus sp. USK10]GCE41852.1 transcriptional regulator, TetR family [Rhodococcus wratislaviensis]